MTIKDCIDFANGVKICAMATSEDNQPRVRMMGLWFADENGFYFQAWTFKDLYKQLQENPGMEVCFYSESKDSPYTMMRVRGEAEFIKDNQLKERLWQERQFLKGLGATGPQDPRLLIFRIAHGQASLWPERKAGEYPGIAKLKF
jgi:pyridoxamine 5'-phosphate oxidase